MDNKDDGGSMQPVPKGSLGLNQLQINQRENRAKGNFVHIILNSVKEWVNVSHVWLCATPWTVAH